MLTLVKIYIRQYIQIKEGTIKNYNYKKIDSIIESVDNISNEETKDYHQNNEPIFVFARQIGDKVEKKIALLDIV